MSQSTNIYITDKRGLKFFTTNCPVEYKEHVIRDMKLHLKNAKKYPELYKFLHLKSAKIVDESSLGGEDMTDDELIARLGV